MTPTAPNSNLMIQSRTKIAARVLQALLAAAFFAAGVAKLAGAAPMVAVFDTIGVGQWFRYLTGLLEIIGAAGLLIPARATYAALLLACIMVGATIAHLTVLASSPAAPLILLALLLVIVYLRSESRGYTQT